MESTDSRPARTPYGSPAYRWYVLAVLMLAFLCYGMDRTLPTILMEPIRHEFGLSDSQLGLVGMMYGLGFGVAVLPLGRLSDRVNRRNFLAAIVVIWSLLTAVGGVTRNFGQLLLARLGVGAAEAGATPTAVPLLSDIFPPERRSFVLGLFYISAPMGVFFAGVLGGQVVDDLGWRAVFLIAGAPGLLVGLLLLFTVREPRRGEFEPETESEAEPAPSFAQVLAFLARNSALILLMVGVMLTTLVNIVMGVWAGSFFIRVHELGMKEMGLVVGIGGGLTSIVSAPLGGWLADRLVTRNPAWPLRIVWISLLLSFATSMVMLFSPDLAVVIAAFVLCDFMRGNYAPLVYSVLMTRSPPKMRGTVMSIVQLMAILVGYGLGPVLIGFLSDLFGGGDAIRYALASANLALLAVVVLLIIASRMLVRSPLLVAPAGQRAGH